MHISQTTFNLITSLRDCIRHDEGGGNQCANVVQEITELPGFEDAHTTAGHFVTPSGNVIDDHWWLVMSDDSILDPSQDQFGDEGFGDMVHISEKDPRYKHYFPYSGEPGIPVDVLQLADHIRADKRHEHNHKTFGEMAEAFGGRPVGDPNSQSAGALPDYMTGGGQEGVPQDPHDEEFKPEEFEDELRQHMTDDIGDNSGECLYCLAVARAIQSQYGGEVWGTWTRYRDGYEDLGHAFVKHGNMGIDYSGAHPIEDFEDCYASGEPFECVMRPITDEDVKHLSEVESVDDPGAYEWVKQHKDQYDAIFEADHPEFMPGGDETHGHDPAYDPPAEYRSGNTNTGWPQP